MINYLFKKLGIKIEIVTPYNHQLLQAEHGIKSVATILTRHLTGLGKYWPKYLPLAIYSYNTFCSPNLNGFRFYELAFWKQTQTAY